MENFELPNGYQWYNKEKGVYRNNIAPHTDEWFAERLSGIGGSEIGRVLGLNDWAGSSVLELFYEKIGLRPQRRDGNKYTFMGNYLEQTVADLWRYYDGTDNGVIKNYNASKVVRECRNLKGFFRNVKYPYLFTNLDRVINKGGFRLTDATLLEENGILECKTASSWVAKKWEAGIPPEYQVQAIEQCLIFGVDYAEIAVLELDNRTLNVYPIEVSEENKKLIIDNTTYFWEEMVIPAKKLATEMEYEMSRGNVGAAEKLMADIEALEPAADGSESYKSFMNERWNSEPVKISADTDMIKNLQNLILVKNTIKELESEKTLFENQVREFMRENDTLDCDEWGKVTWKTGSRSRTMRTAGFKYDPQDDVQSIINHTKNLYV